MVRGVFGQVLVVLGSFRLINEFSLNNGRATLKVI